MIAATVYTTRCALIPVAKMCFPHSRYSNRLIAIANIIHMYCNFVNAHVFMLNGCCQVHRQRLLLSTDVHLMPLTVCRSSEGPSGSIVHAVLAKRGYGLCINQAPWSC
eukprot:6195028-Pleurochrysis_carterae.AAC.2